MAIHHIKDGKLKKFERISAGREEKIEDYIEEHPTILDEGIFIIGRQVHTQAGKPDLLGLDEDGNLIIVELKKGLTAREVVAQIIDYATWGKELSYDALNKIAKNKHLSDYPDLYKKFEKKYGKVPPFNAEQRLYIIAENFDEKTIGMCEYLRGIDMDISCIEFHFLKSDNEELVKVELIVGSGKTSSDERIVEDRKQAILSWDQFLKDKASPENKTNVNEFISKIQSEFNLNGQSQERWPIYYLYTKSPYRAKNLAVVLALRIDTWQVIFRIDPPAFEFDDEEDVRKVKGYWWHGTERRIKRSKDNDELIFKCIQHAIDATNKK